MKLGHFITLLFFTTWFLFVIRSLFIRGKLSMRYALGWTLIAGLFLFFPILIMFGNAASRHVAIQPSIIYLGLPVLVLLLICVQLTISISGLSNRIQDLAESIAILDHDLNTPSATSDEGDEGLK